MALPVYNGEAYLSDAVESILAQTVKNFELIIIDDGSTDNSLTILKRYEALDKRIILISSENCGLVKTLNKAIDLAQGAWFARMDQDDIALPHRFEKQICQLNNMNADICGSWIKYFGDGNNHTLRTYESDEAIKVDMLFNSPFAHPTVMMRTSLVKRLKYDEAHEKAEDYDLWVRAAQENWIMTNVPEVLLRYRIHDVQTTKVAASHMLSTKKRIQKRYWAYIGGLQGFPEAFIKQASDMVSDGKCLQEDMANIVFSELLKSHRGKAREALVKGISKTYLNAAYGCPKISIAWNKLANKNLGLPRYSMNFSLLLLSIFKVKRGGRKFLFLKKIYNLFRK